MKSALLLRLVLLGCLAVLLVAGIPRHEGTADERRIVRLEGPLRSEDQQPSLLAEHAPDLVVRSDTLPPDAAELDFLAALARHAPLIAALPAAPPRLAVDAPTRPTAGRTTAVPFRLRGRPGDTLTVRWTDGAALRDSTRVVVGAAGVALGGLPLRPTHGGWQEWEIEAAGETRRTGARVRDSRALELLVVAGPPSWESKFAVRALEEAGARVSLVQAIGPGLEVGTVSAVPATAEGLAAYDAVLVLSGAELNGRQRAALSDYVAQRGGGVLWPGSGPADERVSGEAIRWTLPADLAALPPAPIRSAATRLDAPGPGALVAASTPDAGVLQLRAFGRGRMATLGLAESWRWRMEAGQEEAHRQFWQLLAEWLSAGARERTIARTPQPLPATGEPVDVLVFPTGTKGDASLTQLRLLRPGGREERLPLGSDPERPNEFRARFVPTEPGLYRFTAGTDTIPIAALRAATEPQPGSDAWARLSLLAERSGGAALPADSVPAALDCWTAGRPVPARGSLPPVRGAIFAVLVTLAAVEWAIRRFAGRP